MGSFNENTAFEQFYDAYPLHVSALEAQRAFGRALHKADAKTIIEGAKRFAHDPNRDESFTPYPANWLDGERWTDGPLPAKTSEPRLAQIPPPLAGCGDCEYGFIFLDNHTVKLCPNCNSLRRS